MNKTKEIEKALQKYKDGEIGIKEMMFIIEGEQPKIEKEHKCGGYAGIYAGETKESWEEEFEKMITNNGEFFVSPDYVKQFIKQTLQERESKYLKVLREMLAIIGKYDFDYKIDDMEKNLKYDKAIKIIKDNNIEL